MADHRDVLSPDLFSHGSRSSTSRSDLLKLPIICTPFVRKRVVFSNGERITEVNEFRITNKYPLRNSCKELSFGTKIVYTTLNHKINNIASKLSGDIETNPGPFVVDSSKTIHAPYRQGNSFVFGPNVGKQCVAMS